MLYRDISENDMEGVVSLWTTMFADDDPKLVAAGVKAFIATDTSGFWPSIGQIKEKMRQITDEEVPTAMEAWNNIWETLSKHKWNYWKGFNDLPPIVRSIVVSSDTLRNWGGMETSKLETFVAPQFQKSYREKVKEKRTFDAIPSDVRKQFAPAGKAESLNGKAEEEIPQSRGQKKYKSVVDENGFTKYVEDTENG